MSFSTFRKRSRWQMEMACNLKIGGGSRFRPLRSLLSKSGTKIRISLCALLGIWEIGICRLKLETRFFAFGPIMLIEEMLNGFGADLVKVQVPFQPEGGAYSGHGTITTMGTRALS